MCYMFLRFQRLSYQSSIGRTSYKRLLDVLRTSYKFKQPEWGLDSGVETTSRVLNCKFTKDTFVLSICVINYTCHLSRQCI